MQRFIEKLCQLKNILFMKNFITYKSLLSLLCLSLLLNGCVKDNCKRSYKYTYYRPVYKTTAEVRANIKSNAAKEIKNPGKIFLQGNYIFLNELDQGVHVIDNSNPLSPKRVAFIDIPGNLDLAVKGNTLYADMYTDLITLDISNPLNVTVKKYNEGVFPARYYTGNFVNNTAAIIVDWITKDTTIIEDCTGYGNGWLASGDVIMQGAFNSTPGPAKATGSPIGQGGSMARFALVGNYLYTVGDIDLSVFNISNSNNPTYIKSSQVDWHVETIYPFGNKLFIGSNNGMFIYDVQASPADPVKVGEFTHARACDPVIADNNYAYVTLHSGTTCLGYENQLDIVKLNNLTDAALAKTYNFTSPHGLSKDCNLLFICDGTDGLKIYDAGDVMNLSLIKQIPNLETYDVIAYNKIALVVANDGLYQYDYSNLNNIHLVSKLGILK
jgi:hypothetical protein